MKKFLYGILVSLIFVSPVFAIEDIAKVNEIQTRIDSVGTNLLNSNKLVKRVVFTYNEREKKKVLSTNKILTKRQVIVYDEAYQYVQTEDELAAMLAREIVQTMKSYSGTWGGRIESMQVAVSSKKFETVADKRAVDFMVNAGYNPLGLIVYINKSCPQKRSDFISRNNLTSKRLARIYEYITYKYPEFLQENSYVQNKYYQNFLLTSINNRSMLEEKIKSGSKKELKYE